MSNKQKQEGSGNLSIGGSVGGDAAGGDITKTEGSSSGKKAGIAIAIVTTIGTIVAAWLVR